MAARSRRGLKAFSTAGTLFLAGLVRASLLLVVTEGKDFLVGEKYHWQAPPPNDSKFYQEWADKVSPITVGDSITFVLDSQYSVYMVNETGFRACNSSQGMELSHGMPTSLPFQRAGDAYFIDGSHCSLGMLFHLLVNPLPVHPESDATAPVKTHRGVIDPSRYVSTSVIAALAAAAGIGILCILGGFIWCAFYRNPSNDLEASHSSDKYDMSLATSQCMMKSPPMFSARETDHRILLSASQRFRRFTAVEVQNPLYVTTMAARTFSFQELNDATMGFAREFLLGEDANGKVYRANLYMEKWQTMREVALKKPASKKMNDLHMLSVLANAIHRNVVQLLGYCSEHEGSTPILVYEFVSRGSLSNHLFDHRLKSTSHNGIEMSDDHQQFLDWSTRLQIAIDTARGLDYLHTSAHPAPIFHGAVTADNILIDEGFHAKVANFGLTGLFPESAARETIGYAEPYLEGRVTDKSDVYSFGVLLITLLTSQRPCQQPWCEGNGNFVDPFLTLLRDSTLDLILDPELTGSETAEAIKEMKTVAKIAAACLVRSMERPSMRDVLFLLENVRIDRSQRISESTPSFYSLDKRPNPTGQSSTASYLASWTEYAGSISQDPRGQSSSTA